MEEDNNSNIDSLLNLADLIKENETKKEVIIDECSFESKEVKAEKMDQIFEKFYSGINSLINAPSPKENDTYVALIFNGPIDFCKKYYPMAKRTQTLCEENIPIELQNLEKKNFDSKEVYLIEKETPNFLMNLKTKIKTTLTFLSILKTTFAELNKTEDRLIEKILFYYGQTLSEKLEKTNIEYYNKCYSEKKNILSEINIEISIKNLLKDYYYEFTFEDFILIFSSIVSYFNDLNVKLEVLDTKENNVIISLFCKNEQGYEDLAEYFGYELQLKPYALKYCPGKIDTEKIFDDKIYTEPDLNDYILNPPYMQFNSSKRSKFRRYLFNDSYHICAGDKDFDFVIEGTNCDNKCSKFRSIDKFRLIHKSLEQIMSIFYLYRYKILSMVINKRNFEISKSLMPYSNFLQLTKLFFVENYSITITKIRNFYGERIAFYFLWLYYFSFYALFPSLVGFIIFFIVFSPPKELETTARSILKIQLQYYDISLITLEFIILVWAMFFLKQWEQKELIFRYLWGTEKKECTETISEYFVPDETKKFIIGEKLNVYSPCKSKSKKVTTYIILNIIIILELSCGFFVYHKLNEIDTYYNLLLSSDYTYNEPVKLWVKTAISYIVKIKYVSVEWLLIFIKSSIIYSFIKICSNFNNFISLNLSIWENNETKAKLRNSYARKLNFLEFCNNYYLLFYIAFYKPYSNNKCYKDNCLVELEKIIYIFFGLDFIFSIISFIIRIIINRMRHDNDITNTRNIFSIQRQISCKQKKYMTFDFTKKIIRFGYLCLFTVAAPLTPLIVLILNFMETLFDFYKLFFLYRVEIIDTAVGIGVFNSIIKTIYFIGMLTNVSLVLFTNPKFVDKSIEALVVKSLIFFILENVFLFFNAFNYNSLPFWYTNLSEIKSLYIKKYYLKK